MELFSKNKKIHLPPLAERIRPRTIEEFVGQSHILSPGKPLRELILRNEIQSMILWGPPGTGKTTLAYIISQMTDAHFLSYSAVASGIKEIRDVIKKAEYELKAHQRKTILFVDEFHRFNKAQQDAFLPAVEGGIIIFIGATTENPSFEIISPLLSRCRIFVFHPLSKEEIKKILTRALFHPNGLLIYSPVVSEDILDFIVSYSDGDARKSLNYLETSVLLTNPQKDGKRRVTKEIVEEVMERKFLLYDKKGEEHYNLISAFIKSMRGSDPDAALYWLSRMLEAGEDPLYIARRMVIFAAEDIGNADPQALVLATAAKDAYHFVGSPEGELALAQVCLYLSLAPKSNASSQAYRKAMEDVRKTEAAPVPLFLRNPVTPLMEKFGYGNGYKSPHTHPCVKEEYLPENLKGRRYYFPTQSGFEKEFQERLKGLKR